MVGAPVVLSSIESDLDDRVMAEAADTPEVIDVSFAGQTGTIICSSPLDDPAAVTTRLAAVRGVRDIVADRTCRVTRAPTVDPDSTPSTTTVPPGPTPSSVVPTPTTTDPAPVDPAEVLGADPSLTVLHGLLDQAGLLDELSGDLVLLAPDDPAFDALGADVLAAATADPELLQIVLRHHMIGPDDRDRLAVDADDLLVDGRARVIERVEVGATAIWTIDRVLIPSTVSFTPILQLVMSPTGTAVSGTLADTAQLQAVLDALAGTDATTGDVVLAVGDEPRLDPALTGAVTRLITAVVSSLRSATLTIDDDGVTLVGTFDDELDAEAVTALANVIDAEVRLDPRPPIDDDEAVRITEQLRELVTGEPIAFNPGGTRLVETSRDVLDRVAVVLSKVPEATVLVRGHTDSDGVPESNVTLSAARADAVIAALAERGIAVERLSAEGVGAAEPVLVDGIEDKLASRRVEFVVSAP
ncbi:MAG: OmpA family protein [Ilumatobacteraceae bacterium]